MSSRHSKALLVKSSTWPSSMKTWSVTAVIIMSVIWDGSCPDSSAVARARSAASDDLVSTNRRYQAESRSKSGEDESGSSANRAGRPLVSFDTKTSPWTSANAVSAGSSTGTMFAIATSTVRPVPHP